MKITLKTMALAAAMVAAPAFAQVSTYPPAQTYPNENFAVSNAALAAARALAADDLYPYFAQRCIRDQQYGYLDDLNQNNFLMKPQKVFDDVFFVGQNAVTAWLIKTSIGYVLVDSLNNPDEAENILMAGVRALGINPSEVKYVIITHEHGDHYGGVRYLQDTYGIQAVASDVAWNTMDNGSATRPRRNITVTDGQQWAIGDKLFQFYVTPGHTPGSVSMIFPVYDNGQRHMAASYGGFGIPGSVANKVLQINSLRRFGTFTQAQGVDVLFANHGVQDLLLDKLDLLAHRRAQDPHPFVLEKPGVNTTKTEKAKVFTRFLQMQEQCVRAMAGRANQVLPQ